ncbi:MerR family transcriptional regulator, partial [bacterium]|nr:MerR family transcriptional regulator [bacterium]
ELKIGAPVASVIYDSALLDEISKIPNKLAFKIGEVAAMAGVKTYVLRFWESEFKTLKPQKAKNGQRIYSKADVEKVLIIKKLLHRDRYSIEGAIGVLKKLHTQGKEVKSLKQTQNNIEDSKDQLKLLIDRLDNFITIFN